MIRKTRINVLKGLKKNSDFSMSNLESQDPEFAKKRKKQFDLGFDIVCCQLNSCTELIADRSIRYYQMEYNERFWSYGPSSFSTSLNIVEPFMAYNIDNGCFELLEEEDYIFSLFDFIDFITSKHFSPDKIKLEEYLVEDIIYNYNVSSPIKELSFKTNYGREFIIGGISLVRRKSEVSVILYCGDKVDEQEIKRCLDNIDTSKMIINPNKKGLGLEIDHKKGIKFVPFINEDDLWYTVSGTNIDIESKTIDFRYMARDLNNIFQVTSDNVSHFLNEKNEFKNENSIKSYQNLLDSLEDSSSLTEFALNCMYLPYWTELMEDKIVQVDYKTQLDQVIKGPINKRKYKNVNSKFKLFTKPMFIIESENIEIKKSQSLPDIGFVIETSGYWKKLEVGEVGEDKKGNEIVGKTWVARTDSFIKNSFQPTKADYEPQFKGENSGYIYIQRTAAMEEDIFKIGRTRNSVEQRAKQLSNTSAADKFLVLAKFASINCVIAEGLIHEKLKAFRINPKREYFRINVQKAYNVISETIDDLNKSAP